MQLTTSISPRRSATPPTGASRKWSPCCWTGALIQTNRARRGQRRWPGHERKATLKSKLTLRGLARTHDESPCRLCHHGIENTMNNSLIRDATPTDVPALARLHVATFNETHAPL